MKEKTLVRKVYRKHAMPVKPQALYDLNRYKLPTVAADFTVIRMELCEAGRCSLDGEELEFQVLKVYLREKPPT